MFGWRSLATIRASWRNRWWWRGVTSMSGEMTLIATGRSSARSRPSTTIPMPPWPSTRSTSYCDASAPRSWSRRRCSSIRPSLAQATDRRPFRGQRSGAGARILQRPDTGVILMRTRALSLALLLTGLTSPAAVSAQVTQRAGGAVDRTVQITEWTVPWEKTRPRDPYVAPDGRVFFVGQAGNYIAVLDPNSGQFKRFEIDAGTYPHNLIVDRQGVVWYARNRNG